MSWSMPDVFQWLQTNGNIEQKEMYRVFNCGVGMVLAVSKNDSQGIIDHLNNLGETAWLIGDVSSKVDESVNI